MELSDAMETENSFSENQKHVQITFFSKDDEIAQIPDAVFDVPTGAEYDDLNLLFNKTMKANDDQWKDRRFEFLVEETYLRTSLAEFIEEYEVETETVLKVECVIGIEAPKPLHDIEAPDWVSSVQISKDNPFIMDEKKTNPIYAEPPSQEYLGRRRVGISQGSHYETHQRPREDVLNSVADAKSDLSGFEPPAGDQKIFKDQCAYCFKDPHIEDGLYINLKNYHAFCRDHAEIYSNNTGNNLYVQIESKKVVFEDRDDGEPTKKMTKLTSDQIQKIAWEESLSFVKHPAYDRKFNAFHLIPDLEKAVNLIENNLDINPNPEQHLKHFGLDPSKMEKTAKSTIEMELDMNEKWEWAKCTEDGAVLEPIYGPGYTGLVNTGSSCYMNSVLQALIQVDAFCTKFGDGALDIFLNCPIEGIHTDFNGQFAKVIRAMLSGDYSSEADPTHSSIKPLQFKRVAAGNHREFSTSKQQDVEEYIRFLFEKISEHSKNDALDPTDSLRFQTWNRFEDIASQKVRYTSQEEILLRLPLPEILFKPIPDTENRFSVDMNAAIRGAFDTQFVDGYKSPITGEAKGATNTMSFKTFPDYLFFQVLKFVYTNEGVQKKLDLEFEVCEELDLSEYRGTGKKDNEEALPDDVATCPSAPEIPANVVAVAEQVMLMGFGRNSCLRAAYYSNGNAEVASNWLMEHLDDADINDEFVMPTGTPSARGGVDPNLVSSIVERGFTPHQAKYALNQLLLKPSNGFSQMWIIPDESAATGTSSDAPVESGTEMNTKVYRDGSGKYKLIGMISHMGSRPDSGHYVAHMLKDNKWVLFNDEKVALSQDPPKKLAYIYLYKRAD